MPTPTYESIVSYTLPSAGNNIILGSGGEGTIPSTFTDLVLVIDGALASGGTGSCYLRFNGSSSSQYSFSRLLTTGGAFANAQGTLSTQLLFSDLSADKFTVVSQIMDYTNINTYTTVLTQQYSGATYTGQFVGRWNSGAVINAITIIGHQNFNTGTTFSLYGIKAA
jgi:hypothetical protein